ncbi:MAG: sulfite exporter TauE/SafE family protein [Clostridia bacterium]|nr:sulfite exporter TauE/SafE family protein [Clostridia bacterium]
MNIFLPVISGFAAGIISGMGIGGGTILIPALSIFLSVDQHTAQGVNLLYFIPTAVVALVVHIKNKAIDYKVAIPIIISGIAGAVGGSYLALIIHAKLLKKLFGGFLFFMGIYEICKKDKQKQKK